MKVKIQGILKIQLEVGIVVSRGDTLLTLRKASSIARASVCEVCQCYMSLDPGLGGFT